VNLPLHCAGLVVGVGTKSKGNSNADKACQWLFMLAMQGGFMSESATVGRGKEGCNKKRMEEEPRKQL
jgi:hypothetical protein